MHPDRLLLLVLGVALSGCRQHQSAARTPASSRLEQQLRAIIASVPEGQVAVAVHDLGSGLRISINADTLMHAASTMKVPVMIEYMRQRDRNALADTSTVQLTNQFRSVVDGSFYALDAGDDSDSSVYAAVGQRVTWRWLVTRMITHSSNLATNVLIERLGANAITETTHRLGAEQTSVRRGVEDGVAFRAGIINETTAGDLATLMESIATDRAGSAESSRAMREILLAQAYNDGIPAGLPSDVRVAHKTGEITATHHDAAIVYPARGAPYVLVVLTRRIPDRTRAVAMTARIAREVHHALRPQ
jgi:beta-lactamase class A